MFLFLFLGSLPSLFLQIFSASFSLLFLRFSQCMCWSTKWCHTGFLDSVQFSSIIFSLFSSKLIISTVLSSNLLVHSSTSPTLPLNPYSEFSISVIVLFISKIYFCFHVFYFFMIFPCVHASFS